MKFENLYPKVESETGDSYESREFENLKELDKISVFH